MSGEEETHVKFVQLDPEEEAQRSMRGFEHRKDLVVSYSVLWNQRYLFFPL
jgi:hypothetical protein